MQYWANKKIRLGVIPLAVFFACLALYTSLFSAPGQFKTNAVFEVSDGETLSTIAESLKSEGYIRSTTIFKIIVRGVFAGDKGAVAGDYSFEKPLNVFSLAERIVKGNFNLNSLKVTIPEGLTKFEISDLLKAEMPNFDTKKFLALAPEGYLFPDTYFFVPNISAERVVEIMTANFNSRIEPYAAKIKAFGKPLNDVVKMASIVETEARKTETRKVIAGILWKRYDSKMPLQVDVSFKYINGKGTSELTTADLSIDSLYNSYKYVGLPPTPIANPGLDAILATIEPTKTPYYFFLTDANGIMRYAATFAEHKKNKLLYLP